jgi:F0F1-type ATP synthase assembly protein I
MLQSKEKYAEEFSERQRTTGRLSLPWFVVMVVSWILGANIGKLNNSSPMHLWVLGIFSFVLFIISIVRITNIVLKHYRCPACGEVVLRWNSVPIFPKECPICHVSFVQEKNRAA